MGLRYNLVSSTAFRFVVAINTINQLPLLVPHAIFRWDNLDLEALATEFGAESVTKNGPQYWSMDTVTVKGSEEIFDVGGADMVFGANLPPGTMDSPAYSV